MNTNRKIVPESLPRPVSSSAYPAGRLADMADRLGIESNQAPRAAASPAAWPTGVSLLAQMIEVCQRCDADEACGDWLARAPKKIATPPAFCPNADALKKAKQQ